MADKNPYQILGITSNATETEIKKGYRDSVSNCFEKNGSLEEFHDISKAYITLTNLSTSLMIPDTGEEPRALVKNPGWGSLMEKSISPAFMLGIMFTGIAGGLIGYSLQPKQTVVREIIREAQIKYLHPIEKDRKSNYLPIGQQWLKHLQKPLSPLTRHRHPRKPLPRLLLIQRGHQQSRI
jgi:DnaJ domain